MAVLAEAERVFGQLLAVIQRCPDELQAFEERLARMTQWSMRQDGLGREAAEASARDYMRWMPAWRDHPALRR